MQKFVADILNFLYIIISFSEKISLAISCESFTWNVKTSFSNKHLTGRLPLIHGMLGKISADDILKYFPQKMLNLSYWEK